MKYLVCGAVEIPLCFVQSVSWMKTAKTVQHTGGYISSRGFEAGEISVKVHFDFITAKILGIDARQIYMDLINLKTDRVSVSGVFYLGSYPIYPELEFTPTNINKTFVTDEVGSEIMDLDIVFSGVKAVKEVSRERLLNVAPVVDIPALTLIVGHTSLVIQDTYTITRFTTTPDSITIDLEIGTDTDLLSRDAFFNQMLNEGRITAELPQGETEFYVISADLVYNSLTLTGSVLSNKSQQVICKTYQDTTLKVIIEDLASLAGVKCECLADGQIDYYRAYGSPIQCLRALQASAGFIMSWRAGVLTCADTPNLLSADIELQYIQMNADEGMEPIKGLYWIDGIHKQTVGEIDSTATTIYSVFRSAENYAERCFKYSRYMQNKITVEADILPNLDSHSVVFIQSNNQIISCMVEWFEFDWLNNTMSVELHYV